MIMTTPMLASLRSSFPEARVSLLTGSPSAAECVDPSLCDEVRVLPKDWRSPARAVRLFGSLRSERYDAAIIATRLSPWFAACLRWVSGIPIVAGDGTPGRWSAHTHRADILPEEHRVDSNNRILRLLAPAAEAGRLSLAADAASTAAADRLWCESGLEGLGVLGVHPGSDPTEGRDKRPAPGGTREVIKAFVEGGADRRAVVFFGPMETDLIGAYSGLGPRVHLMNNVPLRSVYSLVARCVALVSGDAALGHAAAAHGVPTVTLAGPTLVSSTKPWSPRNSVVRTEETLACMPCYGTALYGRCPYDARCMTGIEPRSVSARIDAALAREKAS
jgi:heptosyltransferase-2